MMLFARHVRLHVHSSKLRLWNTWLHYIHTQVHSNHIHAQTWREIGRERQHVRSEVMIASFKKPKKKLPLPHYTFFKINYEQIKKEFKIFFRGAAFTMIGSGISPFIIFSWIVFIQLSFAPYVHPGCPHPTLCPTGLAKRIDRTGPACCGISKCLKKKDSLDVQLWKAGRRH